MPLCIQCAHFTRLWLSLRARAFAAGDIDCIQRMVGSPDNDLIFIRTEGHANELPVCEIKHFTHWIYRA